MNKNQLLSLIAIVSVITSGVMMYLSKEGWGWLLFIAFIAITSIENNE